MSAGGENLTLTESELDHCRPTRSNGGRCLRALCPYHGSDHQRSFQVNLETGRFNCFSCGAWGYMEKSRADWANDRRSERQTQRHRRPHQFAPRNPAPTPGPKHREPPKPAVSNLTDLLAGFQSQLPGSLGEEYLRSRHIPFEVALAHGVGYAPPHKWSHKARDWKFGRLVFPHTDPTGNLINLYGRAVGSVDKVPKELRHDHLPGSKGYFNALALMRGVGPLFVCEGPFDALSLIAAGYPRVVAVYGVDGWKWDWARGAKDLVLALDADSAGQAAWKELAQAGILRGKRVYFLPPESYGGLKDVSEAWVAGSLTVGDLPTQESAPADAGPVPDIPAVIASVAASHSSVGTAAGTESGSVHAEPPSHPPARVDTVVLRWPNWPTTRLDVVQHNTSGQNLYGQTAQTHPFAVINLAAWEEASWDLRQVRWYRSTAEVNAPGDPLANLSVMSSRSTSSITAVEYTPSARTVRDCDADTPGLFDEPGAA